MDDAEDQGLVFTGRLMEDEGIKKLSRQGFLVDIEVEGFDVASLDGADDLLGGVIGHLHINLAIGAKGGYDTAARMSKASTTLPSHRVSTLFLMAYPFWGMVKPYFLIIP